MTRDVTISWNAVPDSLGYSIYRAMSLNGPWTYLMSVVPTTFTDSVEPGTYYYYVVAFGNYGQSDPSETITVVVQVC